MNSKNWSPIRIHLKNSSEFPTHKLFSGQIPAVIIENFYNKNSCRKALYRIKHFSTHQHEEGKIKKIGTFLSAYLNNKDEYFQDSKKSDIEIKSIFLNLEDPIKKIHLTLEKILPKTNFSIAQENGNHYSACVIRIHEKNDHAPIHRDNAMFEAKAYSIANYFSQLSCVLHLQNSEKGGELVVYKQQWQKSDEKYRNPGFGYSNSVLDTETRYKIKPNMGDLIIINPLNFHEILPIRGKTRRISLGLFLAFSDNLQHAVSWA